ncbi:MAG: hypothetical protein RMI34_11925 [Chloroherpetonaceae bacterium]|nr:hypothetical protein [Chloroherpetonaceae bacterium]MCS7210052.1 hypothetical protein [Chloroherpetonaceae bacterium]MDW8020764.1 hypothetical protein [Chloroherpetonaceae bacterium]
MPASLSWLYIYAFALPIFFILVFIFYKFASYKFQKDNIQIEPLSAMYSDNIVGLSKEELAERKKQEEEKLKALGEALRKIPMKLVDGKFVPMTGEELEAELARRREEEARRAAAQASQAVTAADTPTKNQAAA